MEQIFINIAVMSMAMSYLKNSLRLNHNWCKKVISSILVVKKKEK